MNRQHIFGKPGTDWFPDERAAVLEWLMRARWGALGRLAFGFTHDLGVAQGVVQEKLAELFGPRLAIKTYDPTRYRGTKCPFANWLDRIIAKAAIKTARREHGRRQQLQRLQQQAQRQQPPRRSHPPSAPGQAREAREQLWELAQPYRARFRPTSWEAIALCWGEGLTCAAAAHKAGCSKGAMKVRLHRARHELLTLMQTGCRAEREGRCHEP